MGEQAKKLDEELEQAATEEEPKDTGESEEPRDTEPEELPPWQQEGEEPAGEKGSTDGVPIPKFVDLKRKLRGERQAGTEKDAEIARLKAELAERQKPKAERPKRPRQADFDSDEEYEDAMDKYEDDKISFLRTESVQTSTEKERVQQRRQQVTAAMDGHYERAAKLVEDSSISPEVYVKATDDVKATIETIVPGGSENIFAGLVETIGEGSEKVMFYVGRNKAARAEFASIMREDPTGLKAAAYFGRLDERFKGAKGQSSRAPAPAAQPRGDGAVSAQALALHKKWSEAHAKGKTQEAYNIKKEARNKGIDTSTWG